MQNVIYPDNIPSCSANEAFYLIVNDLICDSKRLEFAFKKKNNKTVQKNEDEIKNSIKLLTRSYWRECEYKSPIARLNTFYEGKIGGKPSSVLTKINMNERTQLLNVKKLAFFKYSDYKTLISPPQFIIEKLLIETKNLVGLSNNLLLERGNVYQWNEIKSKLDFLNIWIDLFNEITHNNSIENKFYFFMSYLAFSIDSIPFEYLLILCKIISNKKEFQIVEIPQYKFYENPEESDYVSDKIYYKLLFDFSSRDNFLTNIRSIKSIKNYHVDYKKNIQPYETEFDQEKNKIINNIKKSIEEAWNEKKSFDYIYVDQYEIIHGLKIGLSDPKSIKESIISLLKLWKMNLDLNNFLKKISKIYENLQHFLIEESGFQLLVFNENMNHNNNLVKTRVYFSFKISEIPINQKNLVNSKEYISNLNNIFNKDPPKFPFIKLEGSNLMNNLLDDLERSWLFYHNSYEKKTSTPKYQLKLYEAFLPRNTDEIKQALFYSELWFRITPLTILQSYNQKIYDEVTFDNNIKNLSKNLLIYLINQQKAQRCFRYEYSRSEHYLQKEIENIGHENWDPSEYPDWLLYELENDIMIRRIQVEIAQKMMTPNENEEQQKNTMMQLNMGEGKTSVILPILCSALSNDHQIVRINVPKSLFSVNYNSLMMKIGLLLNQRIYVFPFKRDLNITQLDIEIMKKIMEECLILRGIILTIPEYRLSFQLKGLEMAYIDPENLLTKTLLNTEKWLNNKCRDILDESDEILNVKYQLVYAIGDHQGLDGDALRWKIPEAVLHCLEKSIQDFANKYGYNSIEFFKRKELFSYPHIRFLRKDIYNEICKKVCEDLLIFKLDKTLELKELKDNDYYKIVSFLFNENIDNYDEYSNIRYL